MAKNKITSIIAHIDHGKTTLIDSIIASTGYFSKSLAGDLRFLDSRKDEQERGITLKLSPIKLSNGHIFIDTPGHVDFEFLIFSSSTLCDNHLILIDVNEGITPRTISLIRFLDHKRSILVLNKIDKCDNFELVELILQQINGLLGEEVFSWNSNNIILSSAVLNAGVCYRTFKSSKKNSLAMAFKAFKVLDEKIEIKDYDQIVQKYKIKFPNKKSIFSAVFPLSDAIFDTVDYIYETVGYIEPVQHASGNNLNITDVNLTNNEINTIHSIEEVGNNSQSLEYIKGYKDENRTKTNSLTNDLDLERSAIDQIKKLSIDLSDHRLEINGKEVTVGESYDFVDFDIYKECDNIVNTSLFEIKAKEAPNFIAFSTYNVLNLKGQFVQENVMFLTRVFRGKIKKGDIVYSCTADSFKPVVIEDIIDFDIDNKVSIETFDEESLVFLKGQFYKNSAICSSPVIFKLSSCPTPFYSAKILLKDLDRIKDIKKVIKVMSYTEQNLKCKLNRFSELEFKCNGNVQFEKICFDLEESGYEFTIKDSKKEFKECATKISGSSFEDSNLRYDIVVGPISCLDTFCDENKIDKKDIKEKNTNIFIINSSENYHVIESVLDIFIGSGPLIKEQIFNTFFYLSSSEEGGSVFFNALKNELTETYLKSNPTIYPSFITIRISALRSYSGAIYLCLQKIFYIVDDEDYTDDSDFMVLTCKIPQYFFNALVNEIRIKSKGTAYLEVLGNSVIDTGDFSHMIQPIRKEKGLFVEEKIVDDPEKQRTLRK